jgi:hypothetical protein
VRTRTRIRRRQQYQAESGVPPVTLGRLCAKFVAAVMGYSVVKEPCARPSAQPKLHRWESGRCASRSISSPRIPFSLRIATSTNVERHICRRTRPSILPSPPSSVRSRPRLLRLDVLHLDGRDLTATPLDERRSRGCGPVPACFARSRCLGRQRSSRRPSASFTLKASSRSVGTPATSLANEPLMGEGEVQSATGVRRGRVQANANGFESLLVGGEAGAVPGETGSGQTNVRWRLHSAPAANRGALCLRSGSALQKSSVGLPL